MEFAKEQPDNVAALIQHAYGDDPAHSQLADELHQFYAEGGLSLLRLVRMLERKHRSGFEARQRVEMMFPEVRHQAIHRCDLAVLPAATWTRYTCPTCGREWHHRSNGWWPAKED